MKIFIDNDLILELSDIQKAIIKDDIPEDIFLEDMKRRVEWVLTQKLRDCALQLREKWEQRLIDEGADALPTNPEKFAEIVFQHPDYKCRKTRDLESPQKRSPQSIPTAL